jgi:hypothetical protein
VSTQSVTKNLLDTPSAGVLIARLKDKRMTTYANILSLNLLLGLLLPQGGEVC